MNTTNTTINLRKLGKYTLVEQLGRGGMAEVYKAFQPGIERMVALKVLHTQLVRSADAVERFKREARGIGRLQHNHIVRVIDVDVEDGRHYIVIEYIPHGSLRDYLEQQPVVPLPDALAIADQLADALEYAHQQGMIHRDIKPENVLFLDERRSHAVLADFGIARLLDEGMTTSGLNLGTPAYMPPEALRGETGDARSDLYSLGVLLYEMVTGQRPYMGDTPYTVILKQATEPIPPPRTIKPDLPQAIEALLLKALAKDRQDRFQNASEFRVALQQIARAINDTQAFAGEPAAAHQPTIQPARSPAGRARLSWRALTVAVGGAALVAAVSLGMWWPADLGAPAGGTASAPTATGGAAQAFPSSVPGASTDPAAAAELPPPSQMPLGRVRFDSSAGAGDVLLDVDLIGAPAPGYHYALWLVGEGVPPRNLGSLPLERNRIHFVAQGEADLLAQAREVVITLEADGSSAAGPGQTVLTGAIPQELRAYSRQLLLNDALNQRGLLPGLKEQAELALEHAGYLRQALAADNLAEARRHAEHVVNILDGAGGEHFGDLNGDGEAQNPGDGVGVRRYLAEAGAQTRDAQANFALDSTPRRYLLLAESAYTANAALVAASVERAQKVLAADSSAEAQPFAAEGAVQLVALLQGSDHDRNRVIDPFAGEGGIAAAFDYVQLLNEIQLFAVNQK